jgi:hypothetical protein
MTNAATMLQEETDEAPAATAAKVGDGDAVPAWAQPFFPAGLHIPKGRDVMFTRFRSAWTQAPDEGVMTDWAFTQPGKDPVYKPVRSRVLLLWTISDAEETHAIKASRGERERVLPEQVKRMVRAVDGRLVDWTGNALKRDSELVDMNAVWRDLGPKCRQILHNFYLRMHTLTNAEMGDFLVQGFASRSAVAG